MAELAALGEWTHINCLRASSRNDVQDELLRKLIFVETETSVKQERTDQVHSRLDTLLAAVDVQNLAHLDVEMNSRVVPEGTVSFLFEKVSKTTLDDDTRENT